MLYKAFNDYRTEGEGITAGKLYGVTAFKVSLHYIYSVNGWWVWPGWSLPLPFIF